MGHLLDCMGVDSIYKINKNINWYEIMIIKSLKKNSLKAKQTFNTQELKKLNNQIHIN